MKETSEEQLRTLMAGDPDISETPADAAWHRPAFVKVIRRRLRLTVEVFAQRYGIPVQLVLDWEQHKRQPDEAALSYLHVIDADPEGVARHLAARTAAE
jgi:DNA-binding transcriptional regulator YiaG